MIVPLMRVIPVIVPLGPKYHMLSKLSIAIERFDAFNDVSGIDHYSFSSNLDILALEARTAR